MKILLLENRYVGIYLMAAESSKW